MTVYDSSKGKSLKCITRDKRVPLFCSHHNRAHTSKKSAKCMPWAHLTSRPRLSDKTIFKHEWITHNRPTKAPFGNHVFNFPINYSPSTDKGKGWKLQVPKKFSDKNQSAASSHQCCQTENPSAPLARDVVLPIGRFFVNWILKCFNALPQFKVYTRCRYSSLLIIQTEHKCELR